MDGNVLRSRHDSARLVKNSIISFESRGNILKSIRRKVQYLWSLTFFERSADRMLLSSGSAATRPTGTTPSSPHHNQAPRMPPAISEPIANQLKVSIQLAGPSPAEPKPASPDHHRQRQPRSHKATTNAARPGIECPPGNPPNRHAVGPTSCNQQSPGLLHL